MLLNHFLVIGAIYIAAIRPVFDGLALVGNFETHVLLISLN